MTLSGESTGTVGMPLCMVMLACFGGGGILGGCSAPAACNLPPVALLTVSPSSIPADDNNTTVVTLDGSGCYDPEGGSLTFQWTVGSGTFVGGTNAQSQVAMVTFAGGQEYLVSLTVTDEQGAGSTASGTVLVAGAVVSFTAEIQPLFNNRCVACHSGASPSGGLNLAEAEAYGNIVGVASQQLPTILLVGPFDPESSYLFHKIRGTQASVGGSGAQMPPIGDPLSTAEQEKVRLWIQQGAQNN